MRPWTAWLLAAVALTGCLQPPAAPAQAPLLESYWRPVEIEGVPYAGRSGTREPHLVLSGDRVRGFTGCNNVAGGFERSAGRLRFKPLATTRMACVPVSDLETRFLSALEATESQRVSGRMLELLDGQGRVRMRLEARDPG